VTDRGARPRERTDGKEVAAPTPGADGGIEHDRLDDVERLLTTSRLGRRHVHLQTCGSTNDVLAALARTGGPGPTGGPESACAPPPAAPAPEGTLVTAEAQSGGRGRMGRVWHSPPGSNLYLSVLLRPTGPTATIPPLTLLAGAALAETLGRLEVEARLKWPNDVLIRPRGRTELPFRKVAGILTEAATEGARVCHVVLGIGVNVNVPAFPPDLADRATSLRLATGRTTARASLLAALLAELERAYDDFQVRGAEAAIALWERHALLGARCRAQGAGGEIEGRTTGVGPDGELLVRDGRGVVHRVFSGEVVPLSD
jgi:BirA family transcriptional regulator, biotin operon repressor / biotin---[acetyl-CoA-carboxylase] ligase